VKMKKQLLLAGTVVSVAFVLSAIAAAQPINYFTEQFYGTVTINGVSAPDGVLVSAKFEGKDVGGTLTSGGNYNLIIAMKEADEGQTVYFYVQNVDTTLQSVFEGGSSVRIDLSATIATPPPSGGGGGTGGGGSSGGGGGGGSAGCTESWICTDWNECSNYVQKRVCADVNRCNTTVSKPIEKQDCVMPVVCQAGEKACTGNKLMVCSTLGTTWIEQQTCENGCSNGACIELQAAAGPLAGAAGLTGFFLLEPSAWPYWIVIIVIIVILAWFFLLRKKPGKVSK
jgi:hypothetical protein